MSPEAWSIRDDARSASGVPTPSDSTSGRHATHSEPLRTGKPFLGEQEPDQARAEAEDLNRYVLGGQIVEGKPTAIPLNADELRHAIDSHEGDRISAQRLVSVNNREITAEDPGARQAIIADPIQDGGTRPRHDEVRDAMLVTVQVIRGLCERHRGMGEERSQYGVHPLTTSRRAGRMASGRDG